jgi:hypothetical protein
MTEPDIVARLKSLGHALEPTDDPNVYICNGRARTIAELLEGKTDGPTLRELLNNRKDLKP